jgi:pantetheine-phosphate adenylyltransferase
MKKALYVGSFDPFTLGHENIAQKAAALFDQLTLGVAENIRKKSYFTAEQRARMIPHFNVVHIPGLVADYVKKNQIDVLVRGLRNSFDMEQEISLAEINKKLCNVETVYLFSDLPFREIHSKQIQELLYYQQDISDFVPPETAAFIRQHT